MNAKFEARDVFFIKDRGHVISGWIREGVIKIGMPVAIPGFPRKIPIQGIEIFSKVNRPKELDGIAGLLFPFGDASEELLWKNLDIKGHILNVESLDAPSS